MFLFTDKSLVVYESRTQWMSNLLTKLGILSVKPQIVQENKVKTPTEEIFDDQDEWDNYLKGLDPKDWKEQDHYRVVGLSKRRIDSTENEIKKACMFYIIEFYHIFYNKTIF